MLYTFRFNSNSQLDPSLQLCDQSTATSQPCQQLMTSYMISTLVIGSWEHSASQPWWYKHRDYLFTSKDTRLCSHQSFNYNIKIRIHSILFNTQYFTWFNGLTFFMSIPQYITLNPFVEVKFLFSFTVELLLLSLFQF